jgi:hypothetical protein
MNPRTPTPANVEREPVDPVNEVRIRAAAADEAAEAWIGVSMPHKAEYAKGKADGLREALAIFQRFGTPPTQSYNFPEGRGA